MITQIEKQIEELKKKRKRYEIHLEKKPHSNACKYLLNEVNITLKAKEEDLKLAEEVEEKILEEIDGEVQDNVLRVWLKNQIKKALRGEEK